VKLITKFPSVLTYSVETNIAPKVRYLAEELGLGWDGAVKVIAKYPSVLGFNAEHNLAPKVRYLAEELGLGRDGAAKLITTFPIVLELSVDRKLRPTLRFVENNFPNTSLTVTMHLATYSLAGRLVPRVRLLQRWGGADSTKKVHVESACISVLLA
jgi:mTERF domain-containing protein